MSLERCGNLKRVRRCEWMRGKEGGEMRERAYMVLCSYRHGLKELHLVRRGRRQLKEMMETLQRRARKGKERKSNSGN